MMDNEISCKYCGSQGVTKYGKYKGVQRYWCKICNRKFKADDTTFHMKLDTNMVSSALNAYYEGMSVKEIRRHLLQEHLHAPSTATIYEWIMKYTQYATDSIKDCKPNVGSIWVADETVIDLDGKNVWFWDLIDTKTRFLVASHMSFTRTTKDAQELMKQAYERVGKAPRVIYTDKLRAYLDGIELTFGADTRHIQGGPFALEHKANYIERFHGTLKERTKVMRGLHTLKSARRFLDGWLVHYNFFRPHSGLPNDMTPAMAAGIRFPFRNWKDVCEQPFEITARIPIQSYVSPIAPE